MQPFTKHTGIVVPLDRDNIDTDAIMPKQFMKSIERPGFGPYLFDEWRFEDSGYYGKPDFERVPNRDFVLNWPRYAGASILLTGRNFGCGSSREHAPWAIQQYGFRVLIARSFADIFETNCIKNGILPIALAEGEVSRLFRMVAETYGFKMSVDLESQTMSIPSHFEISFEIAATRKGQLLEGLEEVGATLKRSHEIAAFEARHLNRRPWL